MADIWASFSEIGKLCACSAEEARSLIKMRGWPSRRCSDGIIRTKLPTDLAYAFVHRMALDVMAPDLDVVADANVARLRTIPTRRQIEDLSSERRTA